MIRTIRLRRIRAILFLGIGVIVAGGLQTAEPKAQNVPTRVQPPRVEARTVLQTYCVTCHNERLKTAGLSLESITVEPIGEDAEVLEKVVQKVKTGAMPPAGRPRPDKATVEGFVSSLETALDQAALADPNPGRVSIHRLNRTEYTNAIRDLLALEIDGSSLLPADDSSYGFDNIADSLAMSPTLLDRYLIAAQTISRLAIGDSSIRPVVQSYEADAAWSQRQRMSEDLPFGTRGGFAVPHYFPVDGEYAIRIRLKSNIAGFIVSIQEPNQLLILLDGEQAKQVTVWCDPDDAAYSACLSGAVEANLEARVSVKAGQHVVAATFVQSPAIKEGLGPTRMPVASFAYQLGAGARARIVSIEVDGPHGVVGLGDTPSRQQVFLCRPADAADENRCAHVILSALARRAYRRPVTEADIQPLLSFFESGRREGSFDKGIELALERILVDPEFLSRVVKPASSMRAGGPTTASREREVQRISDLALASRLSFFLWSSIPDDELLDLATRGNLSDPAILEQQVRRMLTDARSRALANNFFDQWLFLRNVGDVEPDTNEFPDFDGELRDAFRQEAELFLESQLRNDRSALELLTADYTFVNQRLAEHYGIPNVYGSHFRRVTYPDDKRRGILGHGGLLTAINLYPNRTSPVKRGVWLLNNLLGAPPPPPPPDVPAFPEEASGSRLTVRERLEEHRKNPACAACHASIDPLGFALENFDAVGMWRDRDAGAPIDASGTLPDGTAFSGPRELRELLLNRREQFVTTLTKNLLTYALGRGPEYYDMPAIRKIVNETASADFRWSSLVVAITKSIPFGMTTS